jgi:hypothetical protein
VQNLKPAKAHVGKFPEANCWGFTAFLLGWRSRLHSMTEELMLVRLRNRLDRIEQPKRFCIGDVAASWEGYWEGYCPPTGKMELLHTAVYIGKGEWLHQVGMNSEVRLSNFEAMLRSYPGRTTYYRAFAK